ncbi:MAG: ATP-grasp domain-containing protein [Patescibacteria group bacterium]
MNLLVIGQPHRTENQRLAEEGRRLGHDLTVASIDDVIFEMDRGFRALIAGREVSETFAATYIRGIFPKVSEALLLAELLRSNGRRVMDQTLATENYIQSKTYQTWRLGRIGIAMPSGWQIADWSEAQRRLRSQRWPVILKGVHGSQGTHVHLCADESAVKKLFDTHERGFFIVQDKLDIVTEYRVLVLGGRALGAIRKYAPEGDFRHNISLGGRAEATNISAELSSLCERATQELRYEFAGVDLAILADGQPLILEVNRSPGFTGFETATGQNVAAQVVEYLSRTPMV